MLHNRDLISEESSEDFEKLLNESINRSDSFSEGDRVNGTVISISGSSVFVDISGKSEAVIDTGELADSSGNITLKSGDKIEAFVVSTSHGEILLTTKIGRSAVSKNLIELAFENGIPVSGAVTDLVKGGYSVSVGGNKCFCPLSQMGSKQVSDPKAMIGKVMDFSVAQFLENGRNIILSRRSLLDKSRAEKEESLKQSLKSGDIVQGKITSVKGFGIFVDIGGAEAFVPKSEISWSRTADTSSFKEDDTVKAKVISIDWQDKKITLSIRQTEPEPWANISKFSAGQTLNARITNIIGSGAFAEIEPGIEGFIHISRMSKIKRINRPEEAVKIGETVSVRINDLNIQDKKISLELMTSEPDPWETASSGLTDKIHTGIVESSSPSGISVRLSNGMLGFAPKRELAGHSSGIQKNYPAGREIKIAIKDLDLQGKKLTLSEILAAKKEENIDYDKYLENNAPTDGSSLGALFKNKFDDLKKKVENKE